MTAVKSDTAAIAAERFDDLISIYRLSVLAG
jgi:hypothetical protein